MAKQTIKESFKREHALVATGILHEDGGDIFINTEEEGEVRVSQLLKKFNGDLVTIKIVTKEEEEEN